MIVSCNLGMFTDIPKISLAYVERYLFIRFLKGWVLAKQSGL